MKSIKFKKIGDKIWIFQESMTGDSRGNRYLGPIESPRELEILGHKAIIRAKRWEEADTSEDQEE